MAAVRWARALPLCLCVYMAGLGTGAVWVSTGRPPRSAAARRAVGACERQIIEARLRHATDPSWDNLYRLARALAARRVLLGMPEPEPELVSLAETLAGTAASEADRDMARGLLREYE